MICAPHPTIPTLLRVFLKIGLLSFGGPAGQIALMHRVLVDEEKWIDEPQFLAGLNLCMLLPGPEAMQLATYVGWTLRGVTGGVIAGVLFVLPGFCVIVALSMAYVLLQGLPWFAGVFLGLKAAVLAVVIEALLRVARRALKGRLAVALAVLSFLALFLFQVPFPVVVLMAGLIGAVASRGEAAQASMPSASTLRRDGAGATAGGLARTVLLWGGLWLAGLAAAALLSGPDGLFTRMALFFAQMAVVTFGGAYAVLSYVAQAAVETLGWLKPGEMIDGLALAETTPGPLILVLTYVGFLAAFRDPGGLPPLVAGLAGAVLTTWMTFIPCFLWIFAGAPYLDRIRANRALSGALAAITAAVVGVILNLSVWFALQTLFRTVPTVSAGWLTVSLPQWSSLDPVALLLAALAAVMLFVLRLGLAATLAVSAGAGFLLGTLV